MAIFLFNLVTSIYNLSEENCEPCTKSTNVLHALFELKSLRIISIVLVTNQGLLNTFNTC